jgi:hypothetical protein
MPSLRSFARIVCRLIPKGFWERADYAAKVPDSSDRALKLHHSTQSRRH